MINDSAHMFDTDLCNTYEPALSDAESDICFEFQPAHVGAHLTLLTTCARSYATFPLRSALLSAHIQARIENMAWPL